ncbi:RNA 2'-phosphotransferase [Micromonospora sp. NPDC048999]|uniref:RNA 2'-phosphotransferase n=1 Tax=Micromonospora sp. NPDC048999 TaxID=3155391 RepID=UPI0033ED0CA7
MERRDLVRVSKQMSFALRHRPDRFGLTLDRAGWTPVADLLAALGITRAQLDVVVAGNDKQRFAVERGPDGADRIRANQGHSVPVELGLAPAPPPDRLFHGTSDSVLPAIRAEGLRRGRRHHVHLSPDVETARRVGSRRAGAVVVLTVNAAAMAHNGHVFYRSPNGVWLTDVVPPPYLAT